MGFLTNIISATVKTVLTPIAVIDDVVNISTGEEVDTTINLLESAVEDVSEATDDLTDGKIL